MTDAAVAVAKYAEDINRAVAQCVAALVPAGRTASEVTWTEERWGHIRLALTLDNGDVIAGRGEDKFQAIVNASLSTLVDRRSTPKPDGWHTYHICGGLLRELTWSGREATCVVCGEWFNAAVTPAGPLPPSEDPLAAYLAEMASWPREALLAVRALIVERDQLRAALAAASAVTPAGPLPPTPEGAPE